MQLASSGAAGLTQAAKVKDPKKVMVIGGGAAGMSAAAAAAEMWFPAARTRRVAVRSFDPARLPEVGRRMAEVAAGITAERWDPQPGSHCRTCTVRRVCPAWPEGREAFLG